MGNKKYLNCFKYINPYGTVFIWCNVANSKPYGVSYLNSFQDGCEDYADNYNYCPYCGKKLEVIEKI